MSTRSLGSLVTTGRRRTVSPSRTSIVHRKLLPSIVGGPRCVTCLSRYVGCLNWCVGCLSRRPSVYHCLSVCRDRLNWASGRAVVSLRLDARQGKWSQQVVSPIRLPSLTHKVAPASCGRLYSHLRRPGRWADTVGDPGPTLSATRRLV